MTVFRQLTRKIKLTKCQTSMKTLPHLMKSSLASISPPELSQAPERERPSEAVQYPSSLRNGRMECRLPCESSLHALAPNCHLAKKLISKSIRWVKAGSQSVMAYIIFHFFPKTNLTVSLKIFRSSDPACYTQNLACFQILLFNISYKVFCYVDLKIHDQ